MFEDIISFDNESVIEDEFVRAIIDEKGLSGAGTLYLILEACKKIKEGECYLEVGIYQASNFANVAKRTSVPCYGVDNFSQAFNENDMYPGMTTEEVVHSKLEEVDNVTVIKSDFREFLKDPKELKEKVRVYFFDGPHELLDQVHGVEMVLPHLTDEAIIFIDDYHSQNVQDSIAYCADKYDELTDVGPKLGAGRHRFNQGLGILLFRRGS